MSKRLFDIVLAVCVAAVLWPVIVLIAVAVLLTSHGSVLFWTKRIGQHNRAFQMPKFRTMKTDTPVVATHLLTSANQYLSPIGGFLRKSSLDELPQLWSILKGDMSFVGPRPALYNQDDLIEQREKLGIHRLKPGLTGWAQINGRDELSTEQKVTLDQHYLLKQSTVFDAQILCLTALKVIKRDDISH